MKIKLRVKSLKLKVKKRIFFVLFFSFFIFYFSLLTSFAEEIKSKAALVMEASTGRVLFAKNPNLKLPPASTAKLVTAMVVLDNAQLNDIVTISEKAAKVPSIKPRFRAGEKLTVKMLLDAVLMRSANEAAFALAEYVSGSEEKFVELMNRKVISIGASDTKFINTTGLPGRGQHITAYDLAKILRFALQYPVIRDIVGTRAAEVFTQDGRTIPLENTNRLLWSDEGAVGGKTGYTRAARHCFVYAGEKDGGTVIVALLGSPSRNRLWDETEMLAERGFGVMAKNEQPVIYFTKADYYAPVKKAKVRSKNNRTKLAKAPLSKRAGVVQKRNVKGSEKDIRKVRNTKIVRSREIGNEG